MNNRIKVISSFRFYITSTAFKHIDSFLTKRGKPKFLRLGVQNIQGDMQDNLGYKYFIECAEQVSPMNDLQFECENNIFIVVNHKSIHYINGCVIQWVENDFDKGLKITHSKHKYGKFPR